VNSDGPTKRIVKALRSAGVSVAYLDPHGHAFSKGLPDLLCGFRNRTVLLEVKSDKGKLRKSQETWRATWNGEPPVVVRDEVEALRAVGLNTGAA
jgi:hypothetical protein